MAEERNPILYLDHPLKQAHSFFYFSVLVYVYREGIVYFNTKSLQKSPFGKNNLPHPKKSDMCNF